MSDSDEPIVGSVQAAWLEEGVAKGSLKMSSPDEPAGGAASLKTSLPNEQTRAPTELCLTQAAPGTVDPSPPKKMPLSGSSTVQQSAVSSQLMVEESSGPQESDRSERPPSPVFSVMSMKSDWSMKEPLKFQGQEKPRVMLPGQMQCDVSGCPNPAVKACLTCRDSYCQACIRPHYCDQELERHQLQDLPNQGRCDQHNKKLKFYCRTDQSAICSRCALHNHKGHDVIEQEETDQDQILTQQRRVTRKGGLELRMVLVGQERVGKSSAGNTILGKKEFDCKIGAKPVTQSSEKRKGVVEKHIVSVVDTPGLFSTQMSPKKIEEELLEAVRLSSPGPQVFLLILRLDGPTEQALKNLDTLKNILGPDVSKHTMVLFTFGDQLEDMDMEQFIREDSNLENLLKNCSGQYHVFNNKNMGDRDQVQDLLAKLDAISAGGRLYYEKSPEEKGPDLRIVLVGKTGAGKSASGNTILGEKRFNEAPVLYSVTRESDRETGEFAGQRLYVVDTPGLFDTRRPEETIKIGIGKAICLAAPGPHVILIVLQLRRFTKEEQETVKIIQEMFGKEINKYAMVLFTHGDHLVNSKMSIDELIGKTPALSDFLRQCHGGYHVFNNRDKNDCSQVRELLKKINAMLQRNRGNCYGSKVFEEAEKAIEEKKRNILHKNPTMAEEGSFIDRLCTIQ